MPAANKQKARHQQILTIVYAKIMFRSRVPASNVMPVGGNTQAQTTVTFASFEIVQLQERHHRKTGYFST